MRCDIRRIRIVSFVSPPADKSNVFNVFAELVLLLAFYYLEREWRLQKTPPILGGSLYLIPWVYTMKGNQV
jgi:hypothetical protein